MQRPVALGSRIQRPLGREVKLRLGRRMDGTRGLIGEYEESVAVRLLGGILNVEFFPVTRGCARKNSNQPICQYVNISKATRCENSKHDFYLISFSAV